MKTPLRLFAATVTLCGAFALFFACADEAAERSCRECVGDLQEVCEDAIADCIRDDDLTHAECVDVGEALCDAQPGN